MFSSQRAGTPDDELDWAIDISQATPSLIVSLNLLDFKYESSMFYFIDEKLLCIFYIFSPDIVVVVQINDIFINLEYFYLDIFLLTFFYSFFLSGFFRLLLRVKVRRRKNRQHFEDTKKAFVGLVKIFWFLDLIPTFLIMNVFKICGIDQFQSKRYTLRL